MKRNYMIIIFGLAFLCLNLGVSYGQTLAQGARYTGSYTKSPTIKHIGKKDIVIDGLEISSSGNEICIALYNCENVVIKNSKFGPSPRARAIHLEKCKNVTIIDCTFENVQTGLRAESSQGVKFEYNDVTNLIGTLKGSNELGIMVQFINASGAGNSISYNVCENFPGESSTEDVISLWRSNGTADSPIRVKGNWIRGGGPSDSSGGILIGDGGGSYQIAEDNILVDPGQYGIGVAGGHNMILRNNKVFGKKQYFSNVGMQVCNWYEKEGVQSHTITAENNILNYRNKNGQVNNWWYAGNTGTVKGRETNKYDPNMTASILPDKIIGRARSVSSSKPDSTPNTENDDKEMRIYLDIYGRICVNNRAPLESSASVVVMNQSGKTVHEQKITSYHTVLPAIPAGTYKIQVNYTLKVENTRSTYQETLEIL